MSSLHVFCDESGFTGENLLNRDQRFFAYSSVAIHPDEAADIVARVVRDFGVQGGELKGRRLLRYARGRKAIEAVIEAVGTRSHVVFHHKEYALATKFFEYAFEPLISSINSIFYGVNFHKFVGGILYLNVLNGHERAIDLSDRFEEAVRSDEERFRDLISLHGQDDNDPVEQLISFCVYNRDSILKELAEVKKHGGWILELTLTSLWSLLTHWGDRAESLRVFCDASVPVKDAQDFISTMVGRTDKVVVRLGSRRRSYVFNLAEPVMLVDSKTAPGVQLADVFAATICHAMEQDREDWSRWVFRTLFESGALSDDCVYPDPDHVDIRKRQPSVNYILLLEMVRRSKDGDLLTRGIAEFIQVAYETFPQFEANHLKFNLAEATELHAMVKP